MNTPSGHRPSRLRRVLHGAWRVLRVISIAMPCLTVLALLALDLPIVRRQAALEVTKILESTFAGRVIVEKVDHLRVTGLRGVRIRVEDPNGLQLLVVEDVSATIALTSTLRSFLKKENDLVIDISSLHIGNVEANIDVDETGQLRLLRAFESKTPKDDAPAEGRATVVHLRKITLGHAWVHGRPAESLVVDADADRGDLSLIVGGKDTIADLAHLDLTARHLMDNVDLRTRIEAHVAMRTPDERRGTVELHGNVAGAAFDLHAALAGEAISGQLDVPRVTPDVVAKLAPGLELAEPAALHAEVEGHLPELHAKVHAQVAKSILDAAATAKLAEEKRVQVTIDAKDIDAHLFAKAAPATRLSAKSVVNACLFPNGAIDGDYTLQLAEGVAAEQMTPPVRLKGTVRSEPSGLATTMSAKGSLHVAEPGAPVDIQYAYISRPKVDPTATVEMQARVPDLGETRIGGSLRGSATLEAKALAVLGNDVRVEGTANLAVVAVASGKGDGESKMRRGRLHVEVEGTTRDPRITTNFEGTDIVAAGMQFSRATLVTRGTTTSSNVDIAVYPIDGPRVEATADVGLHQRTSVRGARIKVQRDDVNALLSVESVQIDGDMIRAEGVSIDGLGERAELALQKSGHEFSVQAKSAGLDVPRAIRLFQSKGDGARPNSAPPNSASPNNTPPNDAPPNHGRELRSGRLAFDVDMAIRKGNAHGRAKIDLEQLAFSRIKDGSVHFDATIDGRRIETTLNADLGDAARIKMDSGRIEFDANAPLGLALLETARGKIDLDAQIDASQLRPLFPRGSLPFTDMEGRIAIRGDVTRLSANDVPELHLSAATRGLILSGRGDREQVDGTRVFDTPPWRIEGVDAEIGATLAHDSGATAVKARLFDTRGTLVAFEARSPAVPFRKWMQGEPLRMETLSGIQVTADADIPQRELRTFPAILRTQQTRGSVRLRLHADGSLAKPEIQAEGSAAGVVLPYPKDLPPFDAKLDALHHDGEGSVNIGIRSNDKDVLAVSGRIKGLLATLSNREATPWTAEAQVRVDEFPLDILRSVSDAPVRGAVSGQLSLTGLGEDARAGVQLDAKNLQVGRVRFPRAEARGDFDGKALRASVRLDQSDGILQAESQMGLRWGKELAPALTSEPAFATLKANQFRAAALQPFARSIFASLDGRLRADARVDLSADRNAKIQGDIALESGKMQLVRIGEPLHDVTVHVKASSDGVVRLEQASARGSRGRLDLKGGARLQGLSLVSAQANLRIPKREAFPVDVDGQEIGDVDGDIDVTAQTSPDQRTLKVDVKIPRLHVELPIAPTTKPQELDDAPKIRVGYFRRPRQFVLLPLKRPVEQEEETTKESTTTEIAVQLGEQVEIQRGNSLRVVLTGQPRIHIGDKARVTGQIQLPRGVLDVQGKRFEIEKGTVTFVGEETANPQIVVTAAWDAPDGTRVYADFVGPLKTGTVRLRSEPSRPQNEILALIMFGTAEGSSSTPYATQQPDGATRAGAMAGGFATEGLSKGLDRLTGLDVTAKIDTTNSANPKPELEVQIARDVAVQIAYVIGAPAPGTNPDRTLLTLDWRFRRNWSMATTFGDQGSSILDILWRYRY